MGLVQETKSFQKTWKFDLTAGITVAIVALPLALGFGVTSGAGAAAGLATAIIAGFVAALLGGSKYQVSGPTGAMTVILVPIIATHGTAALFALGLMAGALIILLGVFRAGKLVERVPWSVMEGFTLGIALVIALQQLPLIFEVERGDGEQALEIAGNTFLVAVSAPLNWLSVGLVVLTLAIKLLWNKLYLSKNPQFRIPASAVAVLLVSLFVWATNLPVAKIGAIPSADIFSLNLNLEGLSIWVLLGPAISIALLGAIESLLAARVADSMAHRRDRGIEERHNPNQELIGQGIATMAASMFGGMPATGAIARTGVNVQSGARTRYASAIHALVLLAMVLVFSTLVAQIPMAALAGVLLATSWRIANPTSIKEALSTTRTEQITYLVTAFAVLAIDLTWGLIIGITLHLALKVARKRAK